MDRGGGEERRMDHVGVDEQRWMKEEKGSESRLRMEMELNEVEGRIWEEVDLVASIE